MQRRCIGKMQELAPGGAGGWELRLELDLVELCLGG